MTGAVHKSLALGARKGAGSPNEQQLAAINALALVDLKAEDVYVREFFIAHNAIDRDGEVFDESLLDNFAATLPGKGMFVKHPQGWDGDTGPGEGRWFSARVERMPIESARALLQQPKLRFPPDRKEAAILVGAAFMRKTASNEDLRVKIDAGVAGDVSVGFGASGRADIPDPETGQVLAKRLLGPGEAFEASLVWLGAQPGARAFKNASPIPSQGDITMDTKDLEAQVKAANQRATDAETKAAEAKAATDFVAKTRAALGDEHKALADDPAQLVALAIAGKAYRTSLIDDIVKVERTKGLIGDTDAAVKEARETFEALPVTKLAKLRDSYGKAFESGGAVQGGDPNASKAAPGGGDKAAPVGIPSLIA